MTNPARLISAVGGGPYVNGGNDHWSDNESVELRASI